MVSTGSSTWGCSYFETTFPDTPNDPSNRFSVGPWTVEDFDLVGRDKIIIHGDNGDNDDEGCIGWYEHDHLTGDWIDAPIKFVRVISMLAAFVSLFFWLPLMMGGCMVLGPEVLKLMIFIFVYVAISSILTLVRCLYSPLQAVVR